MDKPFKMKVIWEEDSDWGSDYPRVEVLVDSEDNELYTVRNLYECPEDACIARDLVSAYEIVEFIELGMKLAAEGYTSVEVTDEKVDSIW